MGQRGTEELANAFRRLIETAETFVNRAPQQKRITSEREALLDAISHAQLVLSVYRFSKNTSKRQSKTTEPVKKMDYEKQWRQSDEKVKQLELQLGAMSVAQKALQEKIQRAKGLLESASNHPANILPFKRLR